jgi:ABC-type amino acid transport substrate-binding protein
MRKRQFCSSLALLMLGSAQSAPARSAPLRVFGPARYGDLLRLDQGQPRGVLVNLLRRSEALSGDRFKLELTDWPRALRLAELGQGGLLAVSRTAERETWLDFSKPCWVDQLRLVARASDRLDYRQLSDLQGLRIGMARATTGGTAFDAAETDRRLLVLRDALTATQRLRALMAGRIDVAVVSDGPRTAAELVRQAQEKGRTTIALQVISKPLLHDPLHLAFPKSLQATAVLQRFDQAVARLRAPAR